MSQSDFKERIRREVPIDSYISRFVPLKKTGKNFQGLCPFHNEKTPSFHVNPHGGYYHCFGCKASGDLFRFVMDYHKVDFVRSMEILSEHSGIPLQSFKTPEDRERNKKKDEAYRLNQKLTEYYKKNLLSHENQEALDYVLGRGLTREDLDRFDLGYAMDGFQFLRPNIITTAWEEQLALELGVLKKNEKGNVYDFYRNRLMFPIRDASGRVVGFSGRSLAKDSPEAKYINSPNSLVYDKGRQVYNLYLAQEEIRDSRVVFLVEGVMDAIGLFSKGIKNVVAPLGTSFTENQARLLKNLCDRVVLVMDGDSAGKKGAIRASEILLKEGVHTDVVLLPQGLDPFDASRNMDRKELKDLLGTSSSGWNFLVEEATLGAHPQSEPEQKKAAVESLLQFAKKWEKETDRQIFLSEGSRRLGLTQQSLQQDFRKVAEQFPSRKTDNTGRNQRKQVSAETVNPGAVKCERSLLAKMIVHPSLFRFAPKLEDLEFLDGMSVVVWEWLFTQYHIGEAINPAEFLSADSLSEEIRESFAPYLLAEESTEDESQDGILEELVMVQKKYYHQAEMNRLSFGGEQSGDEFERISLLAKHKQEVEKIHNYLRNKHLANR